MHTRGPAERLSHQLARRQPMGELSHAGVSTVEANSVCSLRPRNPRTVRDRIGSGRLMGSID